MVGPKEERWLVWRMRRRTWRDYPSLLVDPKGARSEDLMGGRSVGQKGVQKAVKMVVLL